MGVCSSCESTAVSTAKVILQDGKLQEFSYPVKVSHVLQKNPASFICNSDDMGFDDFVSAINADEELQMGQLYFALPLSRLNYPLQPEEMAALAVKASAALVKSGAREICACRRRTEKVPVTADNVRPEGGFRRDLTVSAGVGVGLVDKRRRRAGVGGRSRSSTSTLSAIPE